jgi:hypothetical protein
MFRNSTLFLAFFMTILFGSTMINAQITSGNLQGVVTDSNKAAIGGATVKITNTETGIQRTTQTNSDGFYRITNLLPGSKYKIDVEAQGFSAASVDNVPVLLGTENNSNIVMQVQGVSGVVNVTSENGDILQSTQNQLSTDFSTRQVTQLPLNGGGIDNLALLVPGVASTQDTTFSNGVGISANGNRGRSNNFQIDGQDNNDSSVAGPTLFLTNTDAIGGFQVVTNNFSAEFGRNSGAQINAITKAGTNSIHGTAFWYHNNSSLDALNNLQKVNGRSFKFLSDSGFSDFSGLAGRNGVDPFRANTFGASIGGPIKKDRAFFFVTYQGTYFRGQAAASGLASGAITFDRSSAALAAQLFPNPATAQLVSTAIGGGPAFVQGAGQFFVAPPVVDVNGDGIPDTLVWGPGNIFGNTPTANGLQPSLFVCTVNPGGGVCPAANLRTLYTGEPVRILPTNSSTDELITREDFHFSDKDALSVRYIYNNARFPLATGRALAGALFDVPSQNHNVGGTYTRVLSAKWTNEARFNYSYLNVLFGDPSTRPGPSIGFSGQRDLPGSFASLGFGTQNTLPQSRKVVVYQEQDTLIATLGNHALKFGADIKQQRSDNFFLPNFLGAYTFRGGSSSGTVPANTFYNEDGTPRTGAALAFENLILNRPRDINFAVGSPTRKIDQDDYFFFVQDDWRVRSDLTLNLGLRYELSTQPFNKLIRDLNARESSSAAIFNTAFPLDTRTLPPVPLDKNNWAPRVGFAWSPNLGFLGKRFTGGRTVVRGGIGLAYDPGYGNIVNNTATAAPFVAVGFIRQNNPGAPGSVGIPFLPDTQAALNATPGTNGGDPRLFNQTRVSSDFHNPYTVSYNFGVQQELWKNAVLEVRYVGSLIRDQFQTINSNPDMRFLAQAGAYFGDPLMFTHGIAVTAYPGQPVPSAANGFNSRPGDATGTRITGSGRLDPNFGPVRLRNNGANGRYDSLQTEFRTRLSNVSLNASYTFSKTIDNASEIFSSFAGGQSIATAQDPFDTNKGERALSAFDQRHNFTANFVYDVPAYRSQNGWAGKLLGGYQFNGIIRLASGQPYTPTEAFGNWDLGFEGGFLGAFGPLRPFTGNPNAPTGTIAFGATAASAILGDNRPDAGQFVVYNTLSPGSTGTVVSASEALQQARLVYNDFGLLANGIPLSFLEGFNLFKTPYGSEGRNTFVGEPLYRVDLALIKDTQLTENVKIELRAEATNVFNHRNFGVPTSITETAFIPFTASQGVVSTFQNPGFNNGGNRSIRLGMKLIF